MRQIRTKAWARHISAKALRSAAVAALALVALQPVAAQARLTTLSNLFVFGDSLSDIGNAGALTGGVYPPSPYVGNRYSNGEVAVEYLWRAFNPTSPPLKASAQGGTNFAIGGSTTGQENNLQYADRPGPPLANLFTDQGNALQLSSFAGTTFEADTSLFTIWLYPNDIFFYNSSLGYSAGTYDGTDGTNVGFNISMVPDLAVSNIVGSIENLASKGAKHFLIVNSPNLSQVPALLGSAGMAFLSNDFNTKLANAITTLAASEPQLDLTLFHVDQTLNAIISNPGDYGFSNVNQACLGGPMGLTPCPTPDSYVFWDGFHPTTKAHAVVGRQMANAVPGPLPVLGGLAGLGWSRRLRRRLRQGQAVRRPLATTATAGTAGAAGTDGTAGAA